MRILTIIGIVLLVLAGVFALLGQVVTGSSLIVLLVIGVLLLAAGLLTGK